MNVPRLKLGLAAMLAATTYLLACVLPGEPSDAERLEFRLDFPQPYRVPLAGNAEPAIIIVADGRVLQTPSYRLESLDPVLVGVDASGRRLEGVGRGPGSVRVVYTTAMGVLDTVFSVQVVVSRIVVGPADTSLTSLGATAQLSATAYDATDSTVPNVAFTWSTANSGVVAVNDAGVVRAVDEGTVPITAEADSVIGLASVTVSQTAAQVRLAPELDTLRTVGRSAQFIAIAFDDTGGILRTARPRWMSSDTLVAAVDGAGLATATGAGTARIIARVGEAADTGTLVVAQVIRFIVVTPGYDTLTAIADTGRLTALAFDSLNFPIPDPAVGWVTSDGAVATVDQAGLVRAERNGVVLVTASAAGQSASATVLVRQQVVAARIAEENVTLTGAGATGRLSGAGIDRNGFVVPDAALIWRSASACVATVDAAGLVTARGGGETDITAVPANGGTSDTAAVTVSGTPGGAAVAFESPRGIEAVCEDGSERKVLIENGPGEYQVGRPAWSPHGDRLAFVRYYDVNYYSEGIYTANSDGSEARRITYSGYWPAWSPDGTKVALTSEPANWCPGSNSASLDVMNVDGTNRRALVGTSVEPTNCEDWYGPTAGFSHPTWSPDGTKLAFWLNQFPEPEGGLYTVNSDGSEARRISSWGGEPAWSPDGSQIAVAGGNLWLMNPDGSGATNLTANAGVDNVRAPAWSPDGSRIVFAARHSSHLFEGWLAYWDLFIINRDGTGLQRLTSTPVPDAEWYPAWRPVPSPPGSQAATGAPLGPNR